MADDRTQTTREEAIEAIRLRLVQMHGACGKPEHCYGAEGECCYLADAIAEYEGRPHAE